MIIAAISAVFLAVPAAGMAYLAYAARRTASVIESTVGCEDGVPSDGCVGVLRSAFEDAGVLGLAETVYEPVIPIMIFWSLCSMFVGWMVGLSPSARGRWFFGVVVLTVLWVGSIGVVLSEWTAIEIASVAIE